MQGALRNHWLGEGEKSRVNGAQQDKVLRVPGVHVDTGAQRARRWGAETQPGTSPRVLPLCAQSTRPTQ